MKALESEMVSLGGGGGVLVGSETPTTEKQYNDEAEGPDEAKPHSRPEL